MSSNKPQQQKLEKSPFQLFTEANSSLIECYERVHAAQGDNPKPDPVLLNQCNSHKEAIKSILQRNDLVMTKLIDERIKLLYVIGASKQWAHPATFELE